MKNLGNIVLSLAIVAVLTAGGYFLYRWDMDDAAQLDSDSGGLVNVAAGKDLVFREIAEVQHEDAQVTGGCDVRLLYPQIEESSSTPLEIRESMNAQIISAVKEFHTTCTEDPTEGAWTSEVGYDIKQNSNGILSIGLSNYLNQGGAHPNITQLFLNFDVKTGKQLSLRDILDPAKLTVFEVKEKQWLVNNEADQLFEESLIEFQEYVANPADEQTNRYIDDAIFYTTPDAIGIFYNPYLIAPYVAGPIAVEILRNEI